jgi:hypothetical protein
MDISINVTCCQMVLTKITKVLAAEDALKINASHLLAEWLPDNAEAEVKVPFRLAFIDRGEGRAASPAIKPNE